MNFVCTSEACKWVLLLFVVFIAGYIIASNDKKVERFAEQNDVSSQVSQIYEKLYYQKISKMELDKYMKELNANNFDPDVFERNLALQRRSEINDEIKKAFSNIVKRLATPSEVEKYTVQRQNNTLKNYAELEAKVKKDLESELIQKSEGKPSPDSAEKQKEMKTNEYEIYKKIIEIYKDALDRIPNAAELNHFFLQIRTKATTYDKIKNTLIASREYEILMKNQQNVVFGELPGNLTERQLEMIITDVYTSVFKTKPDKHTYNYIKAKFVEFELNEDRLVRFVKAMAAAENDRTGLLKEGYENSGTGTNASVSSSTAGVAGSTAGSTTSGNSSTAATASKTDDTSKFINSKPSLEGRQFDRAERSNVTVYKQGNEGSANKIIAKSETSDPDASKIADQIKNNSCKFDKNAFEKELEAKNKSELSDAIQCRNQERQDYDDKRCRAYWNADKDMVLFPEYKWMVPQKRAPVCVQKSCSVNATQDQTALIGTLLTEAKNTQVTKTVI